MERKNELLEMAENMGIVVLNAKKSEDSNIVAIHLLNPDMDALEDAIVRADNKHFPTIVIHSRQTWIYKATVDKVEVCDKLLA